MNSPRVPARSEAELQSQGRRSATGSTPKRVPSACQRCRQLKLKCDLDRPCTLCSRAGVSCLVVAKTTIWKAHVPGKTPRKGLNKRSTRAAAAGLASENISPQHRNDSIEATASTGRDNGPAERVLTSQQIDSPPWVSSSAAVDFLDEHASNAPLEVETSAFSAHQWAETEGQQNSGNGAQQSYVVQDRAHRRQLPLSKIHGHAASELLGLLPHPEIATLLVENYFNKIHWFVLVFHQNEFREAFQKLYSPFESPSAGAHPPLGYLAVFSAACVVSLSYLDAKQNEDIINHAAQAKELQERLLTVLRSRLLDIVSLGSIESVQTCVLLGSFYIYHGEPELAWPICGCGLRIAQALNLHRQKHSHRAGPPDLDNPMERAEETRKRCWWAVYEIEVFCSMLYGFPLSIADEDCDIELLDAYPLRSQDLSWDPTSRREKGQATLLSYKCSMVQLSVIVKSALKSLYGTRRDATNPYDTTSRSLSNVNSLVRSVAELDKRLNAWYISLPEQLRIGNASSYGQRQRAHTFEEDLFELQALSLRLAFENARIVTHRPLLSYKMVLSSQNNNNMGAGAAADPCRESVQICRDAALGISQLGATNIFKHIGNTYAASFVALHLFTAAISLSILASLDPLSQNSHDAKRGIRRLMEMQNRLRLRSVVAEQGLQVLKKLISLVLSKEATEIMNVTLEPTESNMDDANDGRQALQRSPTRKFPSYTGDQLLQGEGLVHNVTNENAASAVDMLGHESEADLAAAFDFCEDPYIAQALLDFGDVFRGTSTIDPQYEPMQLSNNEQMASNCFGGQDQSWIWNSDYRI